MPEPTTNPQTPPEEPTQQTPTAPPTTQPVVPAVDPNQIAEAFMNELDKRTGRAEGAAIKSFAEKYSMTEDEVKQVLENEKAKRAAVLPPEAQAQIEAAHNMMIAAQVQSMGNAMGLVDAEVAMQLMDKSKIKVDGTGVTGVQEALDALKETKPYLFGQLQPKGAWGQPQGSPSNNKLSDVEEAFYKMNPELKKG